MSRFGDNDEDGVGWLAILKKPEKTALESRALPRACRANEERTAISRYGSLLRGCQIKIG